MLFILSNSIMSNKFNSICSLVVNMLLTLAAATAPANLTL